MDYQVVVPSSFTNSYCLETIAVKLLQQGKDLDVVFKAEQMLQLYFLKNYNFKA